MSLLERLPEWVGWLFAVIALICAVSDYLRDKIFNVVTMPAMVVGFGIAAFHGFPLLRDSAFGLLLAVAVFFSLYILKIMGAGDAKLVMALATVLGFWGTMDLIVMSFIVGGLGAGVLTLSKGRHKEFLKEVYRFFRSLFVRQLPIHWPKLDKDTKAPFGIAIFIAYVLVWTGVKW